MARKRIDRLPILRMILGRHSNAAIARTLRISTTTVSAVRKEAIKHDASYAVKPDIMYGHQPIATSDRLRHMFEAGKSDEEISKIVGIGRTTVRRARYQTMENAAEYYAYRKTNKIDESLIIEACRTRPAKGVALDMGISISTVRRALRNHLDRTGEILTASTGTSHAQRKDTIERDRETLAKYRMLRDRLSSDEAAAYVGLTIATIRYRTRRLKEQLAQQNTVNDPSGNIVKEIEPHEC